MPKSSTNVEPKGKKDNLKRKSAGPTKEHIEVNVEVVHADGAKTDLQDLATLCVCGCVLAQVSQDIAKTIVESLKAFESEFEL